MWSHCEGLSGVFKMMEFKSADEVDKFLKHEFFKRQILNVWDIF